MQRTASVARLSTVAEVPSSPEDYASGVHVRVVRSDHPEISEVIASQHCIERFRRRRGIKTPGIDAVADRLEEALQDADFTRWAPSWVSTDRRTAMWALVDDLAFPLTKTGQPGRWLATTCLVRGNAR